MTLELPNAEYAYSVVDLLSLVFNYVQFELLFLGEKRCRCVIIRLVRAFK